MDSSRAEEKLEHLLDGLDEKTRKVLAAHVRQMANQLARGEPLFENTINATRSIQAASTQMEREWFDAVRTFDLEKARVSASRMSGGAKAQAIGRARERMENSWRASIRRGHEAAFRAGAAARGVPNASQLTTMQISRMDPAFDRMVQRQTQFASQFAQQYSTGALNAKGRMGVGPRSKMYVNGLKGGYNAGAVSAGEPGEIIQWKLGACDHCTDCPAIASSGPYTRATLPTYPGQGDTICRSNCCCYLVFKKGVAPTEGPPEDEMGEFLRPGRNTPPGYEQPNAADTAFLRDLEMRRNFARRKVAELPPGPERTKWLRERSSLQGQMNEYRRERNIHWSPRFSVGDALTKTDVRLSTIDDMVLRGLDGSTISQADARNISQLLARSNKELTDAMAGLNVPPPNPVVPTPSAVLRIKTGADDAVSDYAAYLRAAQVDEAEFYDVPRVLVEQGRSLPGYVVKALQRGLELYADGHGGGGLVDATLDMARRGVRSKVWPEAKILKADAWFARHVADRERMNDPASWDKPPSYSPAYVAWLLWGSDSDDRGRKWIAKQADEIRAMSEAPNDAGTPAPPEDRIKGGRNTGRASGGASADIELSAATIKGLQKKVDDHNDEHGDDKSKRVTLRMLQKVYLRGAGAFSTSHRPGMTRGRWAYARVNAFLYLLRNGRPKRSGYITDNDLLPKGHPKSTKESRVWLRRVGSISLLEEQGPVVTTEWIVNIVGQGLRNTYLIYFALLATMNGAGKPYYVEVGPMDEDWPALVSAAGIWIRGGGDEVERLLDDLDERAGVPPFAVAGYVP